MSRRQEHLHQLVLVAISARSAIRRRDLHLAQHLIGTLNFEVGVGMGKFGTSAAAEMVRRTAMHLGDRLAEAGTLSATSDRLREMGLRAFAAALGRRVPLRAPRRFLVTGRPANQNGVGSTTPKGNA